MKNYILIIGGILTISLAFLWYINIITEPIFTIGTATFTLVGYIFFNKNNDKKNDKNIKQIHKGKGDNVAGDKIIKY